MKESVTFDGRLARLIGCFLLLGIPAIPFGFGESRLGDGTRLFEEQDLEVEEIKPGRIRHVVIVATLEPGEHVA